MIYKPEAFFDLSETEQAELFENCRFAWEALKRIEEYIGRHLRPALKNRCIGRAYIEDNVYIGKGTTVEDGVMIKGPAIIGQNCEIRHGAYIRDHSIIGNNCLIGHASEIKRSILFNGAQVSHFNYVGDSILGHKSHLGAGAKVSNVKLFPGNVMLEIDGKPFDTGLEKLGALIGDFAEIGCNAVLNPGSMIGRNAIVYPNVNWREVLPENMIAKNAAAQNVMQRHPTTA